MATTEARVVMPPTNRRRTSVLGRVEPSSRWYWVRVLAQNPVAVASAFVLLMLVAVAVLAPWIAPHDPTYIDPINRLKGPTSENWLGTDDSGRDVLSRVMIGTRTSLLIGFSVTLIAAFIGSVLGLVSGYFSRFDSLIMRTMDGLMAFPSILLAIAIMAVRGPSATNVFLALVVVYTPSIARLVRSSTLVIKRQPYVESARAAGLEDSMILRKYVFANAISPLIVQCTFVMAFAIIAEASLSFLGAGVPPETATWGNMLRDGQRVLQTAWWLAVFPGATLALTVLTLNLFGDGLRDALDPRSRS